MSDEAILAAEKRTELGTRAARRLRKQRRIPGNLFGHRQDAVAFSVSEDAVQHVIDSGQRVVDVELEGNTEKAIFREVQWDTYGTHVQHIDLLRVDPDERVTVEVGFEFRGVAPGVTAGGVMEHPLRSLTIDCPVFQIPSQISVRIANLEIGQSIHVSDLEMPDNTNIHNSPDSVVVHIKQAIEFEEPEAEEIVAVEPELIGKKQEPTEGQE